MRYALRFSAAMPQALRTLQKVSKLNGYTLVLLFALSTFYFALTEALCLASTTSISAKILIHYASQPIANTTVAPRLKNIIKPAGINLRVRIKRLIKTIRRTAAITVASAKPVV